MRKTNSLKITAALLTSLFLAAAHAGFITYKCTVNKDDAIFKPGEKISFTARMLDDGKPASDKIFMSYILYHDHKRIKSGIVAGNEKIDFTTSIDHPGWVFLQLQALEQYNDGKTVKKREIMQKITKNGKIKEVKAAGGIGAMVSPLEITPSTTEPADFDEFWQNIKNELAKVPIKVLEIKQFARKDLRAYDVKIACAGEKPVSGILCIPSDAKPGSCPAVVSFQGAGVNSAFADSALVRVGAITFNVNAHGIVNGKPAKFYQDLRKNYYFTTLDEKRQKNYLRWNRDDRNKYYMRDMFIRVLRALEYVKTLPEWDKKHLVATGTSQGGTQSIVAAALDKDVTFVRAGVPGWCDISGVTANRRSGGGNIYSLEDLKKEPNLVKEMSYFDCMFFARRIKCPIYINTGFIDTTCAPSSVFAAYNQIPATTEKHMQTTPDDGHGAKHTIGFKALKKYITDITKKGK